MPTSLSGRAATLALLTSSHIFDKLAPLLVSLKVHNRADFGDLTYLCYLVHFRVKCDIFKKKVSGLVAV